MPKKLEPQTSPPCSVFGAHFLSWAVVIVCLSCLKINIYSVDKRNW